MKVAQHWIKKKSQYEISLRNEKLMLHAPHSPNDTKGECYKINSKNIIF